MDLRNEASLCVQNVTFIMSDVYVYAFYQYQWTMCSDPDVNDRKKKNDYTEERMDRHTENEWIDTRKNEWIDTRKNESIDTCKNE